MLNWKVAQEVPQKHKGMKNIYLERTRSVSVQGSYLCLLSVFRKRAGSQAAACQSPHSFRKSQSNFQLCLDSAHGAPADPLGDGSGLTVKGHTASVPVKTDFYWGISGENGGETQR